MVDSTHSIDRLPSPDLSSLILEDYSQNLGCSPPFNLDQKWVLNMEGLPEHGSYKSDDPTLGIGGPEASDGLVITNGCGSYMFGGSVVEGENRVEKGVNLTQDFSEAVGPDSLSGSAQVGHLVDSHALALDAEANDVLMIKNESSDTGISYIVDEDSKGAGSEEARANFVSSNAQETEMLYTCVAAVLGEKTDGIAVKEEPLDTGGSTHEDEDSEAESDSDTEASQSDTSSSSSSSDDGVDDADEGDDEKENGNVEGEDKVNDLRKRPERTTKNDGKKCLGEVDDFASEEANFSSEDEMEKEVKGPIKSKNELEALPPVPPVDVVLLPHHQTSPVGVVSSIVGSRVVIDGNVNHIALNEGSILWITEARAPLGLVDEIFGPVKNPYYIVRYNSEEDVPSEIHVGTSVSSVAEFSTKILNQNALYKKGYDASGDNDEELDDGVEFSDDEKEAEYRSSLRQCKRGMDGQNQNNHDMRKNPYRKGGIQKQMQQEAVIKVKKAMPGSHMSAQQRSCPVIGDTNSVSSAQAPRKFFSSGSTVPTVSRSVQSDNPSSAHSNLLSPLNSSWNPVQPASLQNSAVSGNLMMNEPPTQHGNSVMQRAMTPLAQPQQHSAAFLGGVMMNAFPSQPMLPPHMQNMGVSGGLFMNTNPFPFPFQAHLGNAQNMLFQNQYQAMQQQQLQQLSVSQFPYGFPTQPQFTPNQVPNIFSQYGQMNPSFGSMGFEPMAQTNSMQAPFKYDNASVGATNMNERGQEDRNLSPSSSNGSICPPKQFHMGTSSVRGRGGPFPRAKHPFGKRRP